MNTLPVVTALLLLGVDPGGSPPDEARAVIEKAVKAHCADKLGTAPGVSMKIRVKLEAGPGNAFMEGESWEQGKGTQKLVLHVDFAGRKETMRAAIRDGKGWIDKEGTVQDLGDSDLRDLKRFEYSDRVPAAAPRPAAPTSVHATASVAHGPGREGGRRGGGRRQGRAAR